MVSQHGQEKGNDLGSFGRKAPRGYSTLVLACNERIPVQMKGRAKADFPKDSAGSGSTSGMGFNKDL